MVMKQFLILTIISMVIVIFWNQVPLISQTVHAILDPTFGNLLNWNPTIGMIIIVLILSIVTTLMQKYLTDQETIKELKKDQKEIQKEMKKYRDHPDKLLEFNKKQMEIMPKLMELTMRPAMYTILFFVLFFRWFGDYFTNSEVVFLGIIKAGSSFLFPGWVWFYLICSIIASSILRKVFKVA